MAYLASNKLGEYNVIAGKWIWRKHVSFILKSTKKLRQDKWQLADIPKATSQASPLIQPFGNNAKTLSLLNVFFILLVHQIAYTVDT